MIAVEYMYFIPCLLLFGIMWLGGFQMNWFYVGLFIVACILDYRHKRVIHEFESLEYEIRQLKDTVEESLYDS